jgi:hypothetical protein
MSCLVTIVSLLRKASGTTKTVVCFQCRQCFFEISFKNHVQWFELILISTTSSSVNNSVLLITTTLVLLEIDFDFRFLRYIQNFEL